ncbi:MAG: thiamine-phosphate kinase [Bacteroidales bacterium]|nr:thiamine-phosphate kinase [Candidatus Cacconaster merdequi]
MRTEISSIGKQKAIASLLEKAGFTNEHPLTITEKGECAAAHKIMLEGIDFDLVYTPLKHLGYKAVLNVLGDLYAAFRTPVSLSVNLGISKKLYFEDTEALWEGITAACNEHSIKHISLDLNPSVNGLCISLCACGVQKRGILEKIPASKSMDLICLSGHLGAAYMGMHVLEREKVAFMGTEKQPDLSKYKAVLASYLNPEIKPDTISRFIEAEVYPGRGYFLTHGLGAAILQLTRDTGFGAKVYVEKIPISSQTFAMAEEINMDAVTAAMNGGDDYKFIFTVPIEKHDVIRKDFQDWDIIGHLAKPEVGAALVTPEGAELEIKAQGY